ncbi:putative LAGLIDADG homing endonuclease [Synechococcus phage ACG-2014f]|uniref:Putative LAGLIDADG homing endonuclease n=1 Tax=Synechococcus phage ACG-2014f TaxID=1493511 RepID=A0A0E3HQH6_9CAUD|nr:putative LAGLIDADG homing endonuclease [Synechococcus phage ACG-2014f]
MDEFSWFVGLYEGEGCLYSRRIKRTVKGKTYHSIEIALTIKMVDEDVIGRAAKFLGNSYHSVKPNPGCKPLFRVRKNGGLNGKLRTLLEEMRPHLSKRRQEQLDTKINQHKS